MKIRPYQKRDRLALKRLHARFGYRWPVPRAFRGYRVLADDQGRILMAAGWRMVPEVTLICDPDRAMHPLVRLKGIAMLRDSLRSKMLASGQPVEAIAFVAPELKRFSRHLQREFGFQAEWPAFRLKEGD